MSLFVVLLMQFLLHFYSPLQWTEQAKANLDLPMQPEKLHSPLYVDSHDYHPMKMTYSGTDFHSTQLLYLVKNWLPVRKQYLMGLEYALLSSLVQKTQPVTHAHDLDVFGRVLVWSPPACADGLDTLCKLGSGVLAYFLWPVYPQSILPTHVQFLVSPPNTHYHLRRYTLSIPFHFLLPFSKF